MFPQQAFIRLKVFEIHHKNLFETQIWKRLYWLNPFDLSVDRERWFEHSVS